MRTASGARRTVACSALVILAAGCVASPLASGVGATASPASPATASSRPQSSAVASVSADAAAALAAATAFETARAAGQWQAAWSLLSDFSRSQIGSVANFQHLETAYNDSGGSVFTVNQPTQDPSLLSPELLGEPYDDVKARADIGRGWLVFVAHPNVEGASAGSTGLLVAPIGDRWVVWIAH